MRNYAPTSSVNYLNIPSTVQPRPKTPTYRDTRSPINTKSISQLGGEQSSASKTNSNFLTVFDDPSLKKKLSSLRATIGSATWSELDDKNQQSNRFQSFKQDHSLLASTSSTKITDSDPFKSQNKTSRPNPTPADSFMKNRFDHLKQKKIGEGSSGITYDSIMEKIERQEKNEKLVNELKQLSSMTYKVSPKGVTDNKQSYLSRQEKISAFKAQVALPQYRKSTRAQTSNNYLTTYDKQSYKSKTDSRKQSFDVKNEDNSTFNNFVAKTTKPYESPRPFTYQAPETTPQKSQYFTKKQTTSPIISKADISIPPKETLITSKSIRQIKTPTRSSLSTSFKKSDKISINDFHLGKNLGQGKFGTVYQAVHKATSSLFALKKIKKSMIKEHYMIDQFLLEVKIQSFCEHQNILKIYGCFDDQEYIYLVLEYMQEGTLFGELKKEKTFNEQDTAVRIAYVAKAIKYLHQQGIAHRDIKPENVVISYRVGKLCDFGWAAICNERRTTYCGTFDYAAPQILQGAQYDMAVDLWCLGVLTYELLVGKAPFYHISRKQTMKKIMNVETQSIEFPPGLSKNAVSFIELLVRKKPQERMSAQQTLQHPFLAEVQ